MSGTADEVRLYVGKCLEDNLRAWHTGEVVDVATYGELIQEFGMPIRTYEPSAACIPVCRRLSAAVLRKRIGCWTTDCDRGEHYAFRGNW